MEFRQVTMGEGQVELVDVTTPPKLIRRGVLSMKTVEKGKEVLKPIYIVEHAEEQGGADIVSVYTVKEGSQPPIKDFETIERKFKYKEGTYLGKLANRLLGDSAPVKKVVEDKPPLFLAPVTYAKGTFTGNFERGFYEREKDRFTVSEGKMKIIYGDNTGVFIGLDSVKWDKAYVDAGDLTSKYVQDKMLWFDLNVSGQFPMKSDADRALGTE